MQKIHPATRKKIEAAAASQAIDAYEKEHGLGKYKPSDTGMAAPTKIEPPTASELEELGRKLYWRVDAGFRLTRVEERKQKFGMALFHLETAARYIDEALRD